MKNKFFCIIISFAALLLPSIPAYSQNSWITEIPDDTQSIEMIRSADSCFVVLGYPNFTNSKINLTKVSRSGEIVWNKTYESDTGIYAYLNLLQLTNGNYFITGGLNWKPYAAMFDQFGDSIWTKKYENYPIASMFSNAIEMPNEKIWALGGKEGSSEDSCFIVKFNYQGEILETDSAGLGFNDAAWNVRFGKVDENILLFASILVDTTKFYLTDTNLNVLSQNNVHHFKFSRPADIRDHAGNYYVYGFYNATYPVTNGFLVLNSELDSIAYIPDSIYYPLGTWQMTADINDFVFTNDNRIAMCGQVYYFWEYHPLFIVTDADFQPEIIYAYLDVVPQAGVNLLQEGDGYVMLQHRYDDMNLKRSFVVKTNPDGSVGNETATMGNIGLHVYPNPFDDNVTIELPGINTGAVTVRDMQGRPVYSYSPAPGTKLTIDTKDWAQGMYVLFFETDNGVFVNKMVKQ